MYRLGDVLITRERIGEMVKCLAGRIKEDYAGKEILLVGVLKGAMIFLSDLCRAIDLPCVLDFIIVSSYGVDAQSSGVVLLRKDIDEDIAGKHVLVVEDIIDTGITLNFLKGVFEARKPASLKLCAAFDKYSRRVVDLTPDYVGMQIEDNFIVGYGLDYAGMYRNLPEVRILHNV